MTASDPLAAAPERHAWMDYAKGICIVAVVTMYTNTHVALGIGPSAWMQAWVDFAQPFRMPDFFFVSGLLLARVIDRPWRRYADKKVVHYLYFFVVWSLIYFALRFATGRAADDGRTPAEEFVKVMTWGPFAMLWFIQMLPIYLVLTKLLRRVPWPAVLVAAAIWHLLPIETGLSQVDRAGERFVFFYGGYVFANQAFALAGWVRRHRAAALAAVAAWALFNGALVFGGLAHAPGVSIGLGFLGALAVIALSVLLHATPGTGWLRVCGERSLPIFLGFYLAMSPLFGVWRVATRGTVLAQIDHGLLALLIAAASIAAALVAWWLLRRWRATAWLYERPRWARIDRSGDAPRAATPAATAAQAPS